MSNDPIDLEETKRIVAANEETIKRHERERPAREAKRKQRRAEFQATTERFRQQNEENLRRHEEWKQWNEENLRQYEEWKQRMTNGYLETRVAALEAEMQEIRALLREAAENIVALTQAQARTQQQIDSNARSIAETDAIAKSNARSIQAWESRIEENKVEAEEDRSELRVMVRDLVRAAQRNEIEHELFRRRFEAIDPLIDPPTGE